jgi:DNA-binding CsgD family transcriptional regulator
MLNIKERELLWLALPHYEQYAYKQGYEPKTVSKLMQSIWKKLNLSSFDPDGP